MNRWRWTISRKLIALSLAGLVVAGAIGVVSFVSVGQIRVLTAERDGLVSADQGLRQLDMKQSDLQIAERDMLLAVTDPDREAARREYAADADVVTATWRDLDTLALPTDVSAQLSELRTAYSAYVDEVKAQLEILAPINPGTPRAVAAMVTERKRADAVETKITGVRRVISDQVAATGAQLRARVSTVQWIVIVALLAGAVVLIGVSSWITRMITRPVAQMVVALNALAHQDLTVVVRATTNDEIGDMAHSLNDALATIREAVTALADSSTTLAAASEELGGVSTQLGHAAEETSTQTTLVSTSAHEVAEAVGSMSAATEEMTAAIGEIADQATRATEVAGHAVRTAAETSSAVSELDLAGAEISDIVKVITSIAEQTNLLALNATIEAARAGEAGKGFAVVATEVKELASETARATSDITSKIAAIQATTARATDAIGRITAVITQINENQTTIAAAVEEQTVTTAEISRNVTEISTGSSHMAGTIGHIAESAASTSSGALSTQQSAQELASLAARVQALVHKFTY